MSIKSSLFMGLAALAALTEAAPTKRASAGKRGLAFPKQNNGVAGSTYTQLFKSYDQITWMYDWEAVIDGTPVSGLEYVPLLHSNQDWCTSGWTTNVANAKKSYSVKSVLSFNEPDQCGGGGSCMSVSDAVTAHKQYIQPLAGSLKIGSPAVTNGDGDAKGINWLKSFMSQCSGCQIDFVVAHYYAWDKAADFKSYLTKFHETFNKPVWVTEFGVTEGDAPAFLKEVLPWMDQQSWIEKYAWHMAAPTTNEGGLKFLLNEAGSALNDVGAAFAS
ncbi:glycoside hydrolase family 128 protein [Didymella exigua CBS 183.55]|uniref:Glycoside hydrolase family 128 protein n=1 Tax=Didymella exigua CBS 183.55 TaxID=1150837 RepID=A0A6A5S0K3_9PLEO|nr:glycoside hydrolase family 128 protein [Didymella exigua CBS 183.55]KAF1932016.1 glycoside hydrolase family 128 protein [Didymella exigua CBS 183.55]